ncbi:class I SAM-dependent methyltransferase [Arthrobacter roseus]|uniref:class I SAM-dependent methyltransferase n=1 Tax=Arthrobacter roseus TaxID=136274 RepID=UPI001964FD94|nr:class I SAM-dependent methyltransferase [Arthrobacter roseus]
MPSGKPIGTITRGTTHPNRLRRVDRWMTGTQGGLLKSAAHPLVVDLGYGGLPATAVELHGRLQKIRQDVRVIGVEIEPGRVASAKRLERPGLVFQQGDFELPVPGQPILVRAFNVLRQYREHEYAAHWATVQSRLAPRGLFIDGTCDEIGRRSTWVAVSAEGPVSLSVSMRFGAFTLPSDVADRLPKALIHRNVPGERTHAWLQAMDRAWLAAAPQSSYGNCQRWIAMCVALQAEGWPLLSSPSRW